MPDAALDKAKKTVYRLLKYRLRSEQELRDALSRRHYSATVIKQIIDHFKRHRLIDDAEFARQWTVSRLKKPFGLIRIRKELIQKGIDQSAINDAIDSAACEYDELKTATELARQRLRTYGSAGPQKAKQRIYGYLLRKGFKSSDVCKVVEQL